MEEVTAGVCLVSIKRSRYSAVYGGGHAKTAFLHAAISAAAHQNFISFTNVQFGICYDERSELTGRKHSIKGRQRFWSRFFVIRGPELQNIDPRKI